MYPFNRTTSIHAESASQHIDELDDDDFGRSNGKFYSNRHSQVRTFLSIVERSKSKTRTKNISRKENAKKLYS